MELGLKGYTAFINAWAEQGAYATAEKKYFEMLDAGIQPDAATYRVMMRAAFRDGTLSNLRKVSDPIL